MKNALRGKVLVLGTVALPTFALLLFFATAPSASASTGGGGVVPVGGTGCTPGLCVACPDSTVKNPSYQKCNSDGASYSNCGSSC